MYEFRDTSEYKEDSGRMPESFSFDGIWIEDQIEGFRVTGTEGRELMEAEIDYTEVGFTNGAKFRKKRYPVRTIIVYYLLHAKTDFAFRESYNKLNSLLSGEQKKLIFADELDKYFIATKTGNSKVDPGTNFVKGEIEFTCTDPLKYSTTVKSFPFSVSNGVLKANIENKGTVDVPIDYRIMMNHENGYIGIVSQNGAMQFGKKEEADKEYVKSQQLLNINNFISAGNDTTGYDAMHPAYGHSGTMTTKTWFNTTFLTLGSLGSSGGIAWGGMRTVNVPADVSGHVGAKNFYCYWHLLFYAGLMGQLGELSLSFLTADNKLIAGCNWFKWDESGNQGGYQFVVNGPMDSGGNVNGRILKKWWFECSHLQSQNPWYWEWGHCDLKKEGEKITFFYYGQYYTYIIPAIKDMECAKIQVTARIIGGKSSKMLTYFGFDKIDFQKLNVDAWKDVPNRYRSGNQVVIKGDEGKIYVNGMPRPSDEMTGTKYFKASPGITQVELYHSSFSTPVPTAVAEIREAWL